MERKKIRNIDGIQNDMPADFKQVALLLYQDCFVSSLKNMADTVMSSVVRLGIKAVELSHPLRQIAVRRFDDEVVAVFQQTARNKTRSQRY